MRCDLREIADSRVRLRYSVELHYDATGEADFLLNVHAAKTDRQLVVDERFELTPSSPYSLTADPATGNRIVSFGAGSGSLTARYEALVDIAHRIVDPHDVVAEGPAALPVSTLRFLYPSRYCQSDLVSHRGKRRYRSIPTKRSRVSRSANGFGITRS
jgi:hypothetical protein